MILKRMTAEEITAASSPGPIPPNQPLKIAAQKTRDPGIWGLIFWSAAVTNTAPITDASGTAYLANVERRIEGVARLLMRTVAADFAATDLDGKRVRLPHGRAPSRAASAPAAE
jgi:hypothetical protein